MFVAADPGDLQPRAELDEALAKFFGGTALPTVLLIEGEPGIGKSTAWGIAVEHAYRAQIQVLDCQGAESEVGMAFCALGDLLDDRLAGLAPVLPAPTLAALETALLRNPQRATDQSEREVGLAVTAALRELAGDRELMIAIDDVQWVDRPTMEALSFALRRLGSTRLRVVIAARLRSDGGHDPSVSRLIQAMGADRCRTVSLSGFPALTLSRIVKSRLGVNLNPRLARELAERVDGNPFWALELAAAVGDSPVYPVELPLPTSRADLLERRVKDLPTNVRTALATVSALSRPSVDKAVAALRDFVDDPEATVDQAVEQGVVTEFAGMLRPAHPLLGSAALQLIPPIRRRRLHGRFAELAGDPEQRAAHLSLSGSGGPDPTVAAALDLGIEHARRRGATHVAVDLADRAVAFTPADDLRSLNRRRLVAAALNFSTGDLLAACAHVEGVWQYRDHSQDWAQMLALLVELTYWVHGRQAAQVIVAQVLEMYPSDHPRRLLALALGADVGDGLGTDRTDLAAQAIALADRLPDPDPWAVGTALLYLVSAKLDAGDGIDRPSLERARAAEADLQRRRPHWTPVLNRVDSNLAYFLKIVDDLTGSRRELLRCIEIATAEGDDGSLAALFGHLALTECWAGDYAAAAAAAVQGTERATFGGGVVPVVLPAARALTAVHTGETDTVREILAVQLPDVARAQDGVKGVVLSHVAGVAALLDGDPARAADVLARALQLARDLGIAEPGRRQRLEADLGDALAATGRWEELSSLADEQVQLGRTRGRPVILGVGLRLRALALAEQGDLEAAAAAATGAVDAHRIAEFPLDLARSTWVLAQVLRRRRARNSSAQLAQDALDQLSHLGARGWLRHLEKQQVDSPHAGRRADVLTTAERRVAVLVAAGHTNREVATRLFVSVRTVEGHLALVYRKLSVRSRTELARHPEVLRAARSES